MLIAQITDSHIRAKAKLLHHMVPTGPYLERCLAHIEALHPRPDIVVATGDLTDRGRPKEYRRLRKYLRRLTIPLLVLPGNHDDREAFREAFDDCWYLPKRGPLHYTLDVDSVRIVCLDTLRKKHPGGELDDERLAWLADRLDAAPTRPTFIFMHHPPFPTGVPLLDAHGFRGADRFAALIARHPQVVRIGCGHVHRPLEVPFAGTTAATVPSTSLQIIIDRSGSGLYRLRLEAPGFALHRWTGHSAETRFSVVEPVTAAPALSAAS